MADIQSLDGKRFGMPDMFITTSLGNGKHFYAFVTKKEPENLGLYLQKLRLQIENWYEEIDDLTFIQCLVLYEGVVSWYRNQMTIQEFEKDGDHADWWKTTG